MRTFIATIALVLASLTASAQPMSPYAMRSNARFLTDRMAHTLGIASYLFDELYMINYDYIYGVNEYLDDIAYGYHQAEYEEILYARDAALRAILTPYQWQRYIALEYFYRPISFLNHRWSFCIYAYDHRHTHFYYHEPHSFGHYGGGRYFQAMRPARGHIGPDRRGNHSYGPGNVGPNRPQPGNNRPPVNTRPVEGNRGYSIGNTRPQVNERPQVNNNTNVPSRTEDVRRPFNSTPTVTEQPSHSERPTFNNSDRYERSNTNMRSSTRTERVKETIADRPQMSRSERSQSSSVESRPSRSIESRSNHSVESRPMRSTESRSGNFQQRSSSSGFGGISRGGNNGGGSRGGFGSGRGGRR